MSLKFVKPPKFDELVEEYGSPEAVVKYLESCGVPLDEISSRYGVPYHLVQIYSKGAKLTSKTRFVNVANFYEKVTSLVSVKGRETELLKFLTGVDLPFEEKVDFALGKVGEEHLKVGETSVARALAFSQGITEWEVVKLLRDYGDIGDVAQMVIKRKKPVLTADEVYHSIKILPRVENLMDRIKVLASLLSLATSAEGKYIARLACEKVRLKIPEAAVIEAVGRVLCADIEALHEVCKIMGVRDGLIYAFKKKGRGLKAELTPGFFIKPQLCHLYDPDRVRPPCFVEYKYDGSRLQVHKVDGRVLLFSRRGVEKSKTLPEVVEIAKSFAARSCIIDGEVVAVAKDGTLLPFQRLLDRTVPRELKREALEEVGVTYRAFDILYLDGANLMSLPLAVRKEYLKKVVPEQYLAESFLCSSEEEIFKLYDEAVSKGLEGVVVKSATGSYEPATRSWDWLKLKVGRDTIDCVVVKALYGKGERAGWYSSFRLAVRDPAERKLYTIGKVSNLSRELMSILKARVDQLKVREDKDGVWVKPEIVFEVTYQEIERSPDETSGYALRVPKFIRIRDDKTVGEVDTIDKIERLYKMQYEIKYPVNELP